MVKNKFCHLLLPVFLLAGIYKASAQTLSLAECEKRFLENNLLLLASRFHIEASQALVIQAQAWPNPEFSTSLNAWNPGANRAFDIGSAGQKEFAVEQLLYLGKKKKNEVEQARSNAEAAALEFSDLLRNLRFSLRESFYSVHFDLHKIETTETQIVQIDSLVQAYSLQAQKGNVSFKDLVRLQTLLLDLKNERMTIRSSILAGQSRLQVLLNTDAEIIPLADSSDYRRYTSVRTLNIDSLKNHALLTRPDLLAAAKYTEAGQWNLKWQRSLRIPDLSLGLGYDQRGGAFNNQLNLNASIPLPLWNYNKGGIRQAQAGLKRLEAGQRQTELELKSEIQTQYARWLESRSNIDLASAIYNNSGMREVYEGMLRNFQNRNVNILEFTDFMESYNRAVMQYNDLYKNFIIDCEAINSITNTQTF